MRNPSYETTCNRLAHKFCNLFYNFSLLNCDALIFQHNVDQMVGYKPAQTVRFLVAKWRKSTHFSETGRIRNFKGWKTKNKAVLSLNQTNQAGTV